MEVLGFSDPPHPDGADQAVVLRLTHPPTSAFGLEHREQQGSPWEPRIVIGSSNLGEVLEAGQAGIAQCNEEHDGWWVW